MHSLTDEEFKLLTIIFAHAKTDVAQLGEKTALPVTAEAVEDLWAKLMKDYVIHKMMDGAM